MDDTTPESSAPPRTRAVRFGAVALLAAFGISAGLVCAEVALRLLGPRETKYFVFRPNIRYEFEPRSHLVPGISGRAHFTVNSLGLRGGEIPGDTATYRILEVGGSTSENVYLDDTETWTHLLQAQLTRLLDGRPVWVGAAGRGGMNARDHVVQVHRLLDQLPRIDRIIILVGVNDLTVALAQGDTFRAPPPLSDPDAERVQESRAFAVVPGALHESVPEFQALQWFKRTAIWQLGVRARIALAVRRGTQGLQQDTRAEAVQRWREARQRATEWREELPALDGALAEFRRDLEAIATLAAAHRVPVSFLTQPSLWRPDLDAASTRLLWFGGLGDFQRQAANEYYTPAALAAAMDAFNRELLDVCMRRELACLDLALLVPKTTTYFFDDVHFTERGSEAVAEAVVSWLRPIVAGPDSR